jgi:hypothetical protein
MTQEATLARFREYMVGPTRFMNLLSCFELGIIDALWENPGMTAAQLAETVGAKPAGQGELRRLRRRLRHLLARRARRRRRR